MYTRLSHTLIVAAAVTLAVALVPTTAFAGDAPADADGETAQQTDATETADPAVTLEEMTADEREADSGETDRRSTLQQRDDDPDAGTPSLARTIGLNALWGGIAGGTIGLGYWLLTGMETNPWVIAQFAGGGILAGGTIGLITGLTRAEPEPETRALERPDSVEYVEQHAPETFDLQLLHQTF